MKQLWNLFLSLSKSRQITLTVLVLHTALLLFGLSDHLLTKQKSRKHAMIVRTIRPYTEPLKKTSAEKTAQVSHSKAIASNPQKKQVPIEKSTPKKTQSKSANTELLAQLTESLNKVASNPEPRKSSALLSLPKSISSKTELEATSPKNQSYAENLIALLTNSLDLPEFGSVKASIEIDASGALINCKIIEEKSHKNSEFLKNRLRELTFPCFNDFGLLDNQLEFTITFRNLEP